MPGINFIVDFKGHLDDKKSEIIQAQKLLMHTDQYSYKTLLSDMNFYIGFAKYDDYPITIFENNHFFVCIEGKIYNKDNCTIQREIDELAENIFSDSADAKGSIKNWLLDSDGDYIILILNKITKNVVIFNDALGRLPLYFYENDTQLFVSREITFITSFIEKIEFDNIAIAEYLLFGYPLGEKTLLKNISRLQPATLIMINPLKSIIEIDNIHTFNFENKKHRRKSLKNNADQLNKLFLESCKNRANSIDNCKNVVSLSGGLDSRAVSAGLQKCRIAFSGATFLEKFGRIAESDARVAEQIANVLNIDWKLFQLDPPKGKDHLKLLRMKNGLNYLGMSYILPFFDKISETYGSRVIYFTGDEGNKVFHDLTPTKKIKNLDELVDEIIQRNFIFNLDDIEALIKVNKKEIKAEIKRHIERYPENDLKKKYVHSVFYENAFKWAFEGEDRNRFYFWSVAPFYSIHFFDYVMNCPDKQKKRQKLYRSFLLKLSPRVSAVTNANWGVSILSTKFYISSIKSSIENYIYYNLPQKVRDKIKEKMVGEYKKYECNQDFKNCLLEQITFCPSVLEYFSNIELRKFIEKGFSLEQLYNLFTLISYIELIQCGHSSIEKYIESSSLHTGNS